MPHQEHESLIEEVTEEFTPKPGGLVDKWRKAEADRKARAEEAEHAAEPIEQRSFRSVKVASQSPEILVPLPVTIPAGAKALLLPASPYRYRSTILIITAASTVNICKDENAATGGTGTPWPTGIPLPLYCRGQVWGYNPGGAAVTVSVVSEVYAPEI
jgi:hypothetical protein